MKRRVTAVLLTATILLFTGYGVLGLVVYTRAATVIPHCEAGPRAAWADNRPDGFVTGGAFGIPALDTTPYEMPVYETVSFPSRDDSVTIHAWYVPAQGLDSAKHPAIILTHGFNDCQHVPAILLPAGMLNRADFNVLLIDLRNHGESQITNGRMSGGIMESRDVLGAWDWLVHEKGISPQRIGLFGISLGAATSLIAAAEESRVAAVWEDSSFSNVEIAIKDELKRNGFPDWFAPAGVMAGRLIDGVDVAAYSPVQAATTLKDKPLYLVHGAADTRMPVEHAYLLAEALRVEGQQVEPWIIPDCEHVNGVFENPEDYENRLIQFFRTSLGS